MTAAAADALLATVVNNSGFVRAGSMVERAGEIVLEGASVANSGTLDASGLAGDGGRVTLHSSGNLSHTGSIRADAAPDSAGKGGTVSLVASLANPGSLAQIDGGISARGGNLGGDGGFVETSAASVQIGAKATVSTLAAHGKSGTWLIDPVDFTIAAAGGNITGAALADDLSRGNVIILSSSGTSGTAGDLNVNDAVAWSANKLTLNAQNNININANLNGSGTASLALEYGQQAVAAGSTSEVILHAPVNLTDGPHFSTKLGSDGVVKNFTVITTLGLAGSVTGTDMQGMRGGLTSNYALGADIDATETSGWNTGAGFTPVGSVSDSFTGSLNGLGHTISHLTINQPGADYLGLIGMALSGVQVRNVSLTDVRVQGHTELGGLVGWNEGTVANCSMTGSVNGARFVGGLVGENFGRLINSYATGSVGGVLAIGGLAGTNHGSLSNCYATGAVSGVVSVGGLVGSGSAGVISNSYATGSVDGDDSVGGLAGDSQGSISNSYATGSIHGLRDVGGLVGLYQGGTVNNSFWDTAATGQATSAGGGTGLSSAQMMQLASFSDWNVNAPNTIANTGGSGAVWRIYEGHTAPLLTSFLTGVTLTDAPDVVATYTSTAQSGASTALGSVLGAAATGTKAGFYNGYYSSQQGYDITGGNLTINRASLTVSGITVANKVYDATPTAIPGGTAAISALGSDEVTLGGSASATFLDKNVGTGKSVTVAGYTISGSDAGNYTLVQPAGLSANITPADLNVGGLTAANKVYDGNRTATLSGTAAISKLGTDDVSLGGSGSGSFADSNFGIGKAVTVTGYTISGSDAGNYNLVQPTGVAADISKAHLTVTADDKSRAYGAANPSLTTTLSGSVNGENASTAAVGGTGSATTAATPSSGVGTAVITAGAGSLSAANYDFTTLVHGTLTISSVQTPTPPAPVAPTPPPPSTAPIAPPAAPAPPATTTSSALPAAPLSPIKQEAPAIAIAPPPVIIPAAPEDGASSGSFTSVDERSNDAKEPPCLCQ